MGIFDALNTSVAGLQSQSFALQNISGNIANASTVGYKGINTTFEDLIPEALTPNKQPAGSVAAFSQQTITAQGNVSSSTVATNIAINGDGFFSVQKPAGITDNVPQFSGVVDYTRRGDFQLNANGNLVNGAGYFLEGVLVDPKTGNPLGNAPDVLKFQNTFVPAQATTTITYSANLPTTPSTAASANAAPGTITAAGGLNPADFPFTDNPEVAGTPPPPFVNTSDTNSTPPVIPATSPFNGGTSNGAAAGQPVVKTTPLNELVNFGTSFTVNAASPTPPPGTTATTTIQFSNTPGGPAISGAAGIPGTPGTITVNLSPTATGGGGAGGQADVNDLLAAIDTATANTTNPSTITTSGTTSTVTLNTGLANNFAISPDTSGIFGTLGFSSLPSATRSGGGGPGTGTVIGSVLTTFNSESISGGAVTVFNAAGTPINVQLRWAKVDSASLGGAHQDVWNLFYQNDPTASGNTVAWTNVGTNFIFNNNGALTSPANGAVTIPTLTVSGQSLSNVTIDIPNGGLTQFATSGGTATIGGITQNGFAAGQLQSVAVNNTGLVVGTFSNGQNIDLASITLSHFNGTNFLKALDGGAYAVTDQSGPAILGASGTISGSSLEGSNTDIADEFTKLIVTQQAYSANTKVITTADDMVQSLLNVLR
ncbi:MAG TPA: flagellar hook-basal body complex protein [Bradyrhizobium sp.]|nr:flagellar hook-basal body complex protein [Bradyrhizobium sp.]